VPRDGKTVPLSLHNCRQLLEAPEGKTELQRPVDLRDRAMLAVLAYSGCRAGELVRLRVRDFKTSGEHRILNITGKGGKERTTPLHLEAVERLTAWLAVPGIKDDPAGPLFPAARSARGMGRDRFTATSMTTRAVEKLIGRYAPPWTSISTLPSTRSACRPCTGKTDKGTTPPTPADRVRFVEHLTRFLLQGNSPGRGCPIAVAPTPFPVNTPNRPGHRRLVYSPGIRPVVLAPPT
jgi:hypothetical protein